MLLLKKLYENTKVNSIDTRRFVFKTKYNTDKTELKSETPDTSALLEKQITILKSLK